MSEIEVAVCPRCARPFAPGADYCTHCGGQLGIAETTIPYIPVPNSARFSDSIETEASDPKRVRPVFRIVAVVLTIWLLIGWLVWALLLAG